MQEGTPSVNIVTYETKSRANTQKLRVRFVRYWTLACFVKQRDIFHPPPPTPHSEVAEFRQLKAAPLHFIATHPLKRHRRRKMKTKRCSIVGRFKQAEPLQPNQGGVGRPTTNSETTQLIPHNEGRGNLITAIHNSANNLRLYQSASHQPPRKVSAGRGSHTHTHAHARPRGALTS